MRKGLTILAGAAVLALGVAGRPAVAETVSFSIGVPNWASARATANIIKAIAEEKLDASVELVPAESPQIFEEMGRQIIGRIDVHPEIWLPNQEDLRKKYVDQRQTVQLGEKSYKVIQGMCVTKRTQDEHDITSIHDLKKPEMVKLFDTHGDGKGEMWIGWRGWGSTNVEKVKARDYGYADLYELDTRREEDFMKTLAGAVEQDKPIVFFCYQPHYMWQLYDPVVLEEPAYDPSRWHMVQPTEDVYWYAKSKVDVAWPPTEIHIAFSKRLETQAPGIVQFLENIQLDSELVSEWVRAVDYEKKSPYYFAREWVAANGPKVDEWLGLADFRFGRDKDQ